MSTRRDLSPQQHAAVASVLDWLEKRDRPYFYLAGFAGTGKTFLAAHIAELVGGNVVFAAFTGKAAQVMRAKGCAGARTIHSLIYRPVTEVSCSARPACGKPCKADAGCQFRRTRHTGRVLNEDSDLRWARLCVIDEASMVDGRMGHDLLSFSVPILALGDEAQLPPIAGRGFFTNKPDCELTDIHRQSAGSPVINLATRVRLGQRLDLGTYGDSAVLSCATISDADARAALEADQVICGRNKTRHQLNERIRRHRGFGGPTPQVGEKVVCLKNNRDLGLWNGGIWTVVETAGIEGGFVQLVVENDDGGRVEVNAPIAAFGSDERDWPGQPFDYGYAITCHKSQGSQWGMVLIFDEAAALSSICRPQQWLYTAISRAAQRVVVAR